MNAIEKPMSETGATLRDLLKGNEKNFPVRLSMDYPRIVKKICNFWEDPVSMRRYFKELLLTKREKRQGFSFDVYQEIFLLSNYYSATLSTKEQIDDFWNSIYLY